MSLISRTTVDTNILRIRELIALNQATSEYIEPLQIPLTGDKGKVRWYSTIELLSTISVPTTSTNVLDLLQSLQPGLSSLQAGFSTTIGEAQWVSTSTFYHTLDRLSYTYKYISATTLYDCFRNLGNMQVIGNELGPMIFGSNLSGGYVSTINPGKYGIYKSTIQVSVANIPATQIHNNEVFSTVTFNIGGFSNLITSYSQMEVEVQTNMPIYFYNGLQDTCYFSSVLVNAATNTTVGRSALIDIPYYNSNFTLSQVKFLLNANDLDPFPSTLILRHQFSNSFDDDCQIASAVPKRNGVFVTLFNQS